MIAPMAKKAGKHMTAAEQSSRFIEAAKDIGADESGKPFEKALKKIIRPSGRRSRPSHRKAST
jgi:hypothetical protein